MLNELKNEANYTLTENGAITYRSTGSECLDLFASVGALRSASDTDIIGRFLQAFADDRDLAMKILFFARDIRGGLGERRVFRVILRWLAAMHPESVRKNVGMISEYGRFDDLLVLIGTPCEVVQGYAVQISKYDQSVNGYLSMSVFILCIVALRGSYDICNLFLC